jgi:indole-3-glycerol phosphate synthase
MERAASAHPPSFAAALRRADIGIVAEIKRRSPSRGPINTGINAERQAVAYAEGGASALSVLTETEHFGGSIEDLRSVAAAVTIPVLRKDFCVDALQLLEARAAGAAAVLLIARALQPSRLAELAASAAEIGLEALVEVRSESELARAIALGAKIIGINNRDLESLDIDPEVSRRLIPIVPQDRLVVYESGVASRADVELAAEYGADSVLVGSALSRAADPRAMVVSLTGVARKPRVSRG